MDPAKNIAEIATAAGLKTISKFFSFESAKDVRSNFGPAKLICANHCCAHIDDLQGIVRGVKELLAKDGAPQLFAPFVMPFFVAVYFLLMLPITWLVTKIWKR